MPDVRRLFARPRVIGSVGAERAGDRQPRSAQACRRQVDKLQGAEFDLAEVKGARLVPLPVVQVPGRRSRHVVKHDLCDRTSGRRCRVDRWNDIPGCGIDQRTKASIATGGVVERVGGVLASDRVKAMDTEPAAASLRPGSKGVLWRIEPRGRSAGGRRLGSPSPWRRPLAASSFTSVAWPPTPAT